MLAMLYTPYSKTRFEAAEAAFNALPDVDKALFIAKLFDAGFDLPEDVDDALIDTETIAAKLYALLNDEPVTDICGYPVGSRNSAIASRAFDGASLDREAV